MSITHPNRPPFRALVVDDDPRWRGLIAEVVQAAGGEAETWAEPSTDATGFDIAVLDLALDASDPDRLDGLTLVDRLGASGTPCIVVSGRPEADLPAGLRAGRPHVAGVLSKAAFRREALEDLLRQALVRRPAKARRRVLIVEDDERWCAMYQEVLGEAGYDLQVAVSYGEARGQLGRADFALAVVDLHLVSSAAPDENRDGFWLMRAARQRGVPAVVVSALGAPEDVDRAYDEYGVFAFVEKEAFDRRNFRRTVEEAIAAGDKRRTAESETSDAAGGEPAGPPLNRPGSPRLDDLTDRERQVLDLLTQGHTNRQIAEALHITPNTVKKHVDHILQKLGVSNRAAAVGIALKG